MTIRVWGYLNEYEQERKDILDAVDTVFGSGQLILGPSVEAFESEYADFHGLPHCISLDNGTNALVLALRALGVGRGDEVITVSNTAAPTVVAIDAAGAVPVFVDVDPRTYLMDVDSVESVITDRTRCLLPVHLYGQSVRMDPLLAVARRHRLSVLEDCAQAHGARHHGRLVGTMGDAAAYSFYPTKVLGAYGDGGAVLTASADVDRHLRRLRFYGMEGSYHVLETPGHNSRLDEVQAEILRRKLTRFGTYLARRREIAERYRAGLADTAVALPETAEGNDHVYYLYVARHPDRDAVLSKVAEQDIRLSVSYRWPVHTMNGFEHLGYEPGALPVTESLADEIFSLPMYASLTEGEQDRVIEAVRDAAA